MSDFTAIQEYVVENISRPVKYIIYKLKELIRVTAKFMSRSVPTGAASGYSNIEKVEGNTVKFNQLVQNGDFSDGTIGWIVSTRLTSSVSNNEATFTANDNADGANKYISQSINYISGHKYLISFDWRSNRTSLRLYLSSTIRHIESDIINTWVTFSEILTNNNYDRFGISLENLDMLVGYYFSLRKIQIIDLTAIFGAGNEPSTVADFEAWMAQNIGTLPYYDYNAGELLSVKMSGMQTEDSSQQTLDTIALDVTTITGINTATNVREVIFADGMKQADYAGTVKDEIDLMNDTATVRVGSRAYQSGDESDTDVITDGTTTYYALTTPIEYTDLQDANGNPLNPRYKVEQGGTEQVLPANTSTPTTVAPTLTTTYTKDVH